MLAPFDQGDDDVPGIAPGLVVTEDMAALEFARKWGGRLAYCHDHGKWFEYDGNIWRVCKTPVAFHYARELCRRLSFSALAGAQLQKTRFAAGVEQFARADPTFARTAEFWDQDIWTLGTPDGTVDLRTGRIRPAVQSEHITKSTAVSPDLFEDCPAWTTFLEQATGGDESMMRFMQQIAGMALTGDISEQSLFFIWGPGGNGKGTFIHTIESILGDYAEDAAMDSFTAHRSSQHPTDLASLRGARLVTASETESGAAWNEQRIKQLTGGDMISARFMRQDFFKYLPQFTLVIIGNDKPTLRTIDDAIRRRFNIIPFTVKPDIVDLKLGDKLQAEWPGILRWMINGCLDWQENGLIRPQSVLDATGAYFEEQDIFGQWLEDECEAEPTNRHKWETVAVLFKSWVGYSESAGEHPGSRKGFGEMMRRRGLTPDKGTRGVRRYLGIQLKNQESQRNDDNA